METIKDIISNTSNGEYDILEEKIIHNSDKPIHYYICVRKSSKTKYQMISKYIIIDLIDKEEELNALISKKELFENFLVKNIAPIFFKHRDDIRWNIYLFFVVNDLNKLNNKVYEIEHNDDYARKFIFSKKKFVDFLENGFLGDINIENNNGLKTNFILEWETILAKNGLRGCMFNKMNSNSVNDYIDLSKNINPIGRPILHASSNDFEGRYLINHIDRISVNNFRNHCFGEEFKFNPGLVNLISGSNGGGKTSLCEAIEFGLTGKIKGEKLKSLENVTINCSNDENKNIIFHSNKSPSQEREIDLEWYGTTTTGNKSRLSENFSIFNYLKANSANNFFSGDFNINPLLKNLIYGDETTEAQAKIENYKKKFFEVKFSLKNMKNNLDDEIITNEQEISVYKEKSIDFDLNAETINNLFVKKKYQGIDLTERINLFYSDLIGIDKSISFLEEYLQKNINIINYKQIIDVYNAISKEYSKGEKRVLAFEEKENVLKELLKSKENIIFAINNVFDSIKVTSEFIEHYKIIKNDIVDSKTELANFKNTYQKKIKLKYLMDIVILKYQELKDINELPHYDINEFNKLADEINECDKKTSNIESKINNQKKQIDYSIDIKSNILALGKKYILKNPQNSTCPLCGHDYLNFEMLQKTVEKAETLKELIDEELTNFLEEKERLIALKNKYQKSLEDMKNARNCLDKFNNLKNDVREIIPFSDNTSPKEIYAKIMLELEKLASYIEENKTNNYNIEALLATKEYLEFDNNNKYDKFSEYLEAKLIQNKINYSNQLTLANKIDERIFDISNNARDLEKEKEHLESMKDSLNIYNNIIFHLEFIDNNFANIREVSNLKNWLIIYKNFYNNLLFLHKGNAYKEKNQILKDQLKKIIDQREILLKKIRRCDLALNTFNSLSSLEDNMKQFIDDNASSIENIFLTIHRPKEFRNLVINNGEIIFTRNSTAEETNIKQISTGQATSLILAVMLVLHLSAKKAPRILILDEPVANLDDMHIMNMVDILRELSLNGTQIFITTANEQVAMFLRRKFSFFGNSFKHILVKRNDSSPSHITELTYNPDSEEPIILKIC